MLQNLDQILVLAKQYVLGRLAPFLPDALLSVISGLISVGAILAAFGLLFGIVTVVERKALGRIQNRYGPNRVGPFGFFQFLADGVKTLTKEDIVPARVDGLIHYLAPLVLVVPVVLTYTVIPIGRQMTAIDMENGVLFFFAIGAATELSVFMAGWSSRNKYSLLGAGRAIAQMISYEIPLILSALAVVMVTGTLSPNAIVSAQDFDGMLPQWNVFTPWGLAAFVVFMIATTAEANRSPFDIPEGESEIVAGYYIEYSGFKFALFFLGEYLGLFAMSGMAITLFLGGWHAPLPILEFIPSYVWFFLKLIPMILCFIWVRGTMPRLRMDQLLSFAWKFLLPMALINVVNAGLWRWWGSGALRWLVCGALVFLPAYGLLTFMNRQRKYGLRQYRFAE